MMFKKAAAAGLLLVGMGNISLAVAPPCLDRPTPPPCCADGKCYPNPLTFGVYPTRWRKWPVEYVESMPAGQVAPGTQPDSTEYPRFETPSAEEEDRKAPPPTTPREEPLKTPAANAPAGEGAQQNTRPQTAPLTQPGEKTEPTGPRRTLPPYEPQGPGPKPLNMLNNQGKSGESDPPPALPFGPQRVEESTPIRQASYAPAMPVHHPVRSAVNVSSDDPPPGLPAPLAASFN